MTLSRIGRISKALVVSMAVVLGMSACGGYTVGFMWVPGTQYNQIAGLKIDDFTGNLTKMVAPRTAPGGVESRVDRSAAGRKLCLRGEQGHVHAQGKQWRWQRGGLRGGRGWRSYLPAVLYDGGKYAGLGSTDSSGSYLYVLDQFAPDCNGDQRPADGDITVFSIDGNTGRLQLVPNQSDQDTTGPQTGQQLNYFEVGQTPTMLRVGGGCVYTLDSGDQSILPYGIGQQGQLVVESNSQGLHADGEHDFAECRRRQCLHYGCGHQHDQALHRPARLAA